MRFEAIHMTCPFERNKRPGRRSMREIQHLHLPWVQHFIGQGRKEKHGKITQFFNALITGPFIS
jgi:hypothetical protein